MHTQKSLRSRRQITKRPPLAPTFTLLSKIYWQKIVNTSTITTIYSSVYRKIFRDLIKKGAAL